MQNEHRFELMQGDLDTLLYYLNSYELDREHLQLILINLCNRLKETSNGTSTRTKD